MLIIRYLNYIDEEVKSWSYMKFPYLRSMERKMARTPVGPLARHEYGRFYSTPLAQKELNNSGIHKKGNEWYVHAYALGKTY